MTMGSIPPTHAQMQEPEKLNGKYEASRNPHPIERFLPLLKGVTSLHTANRGFVACCPAHDDRHPSLSIWEDGDDRVGIYCHTGCSQDNILSALGFTWHDLYRDRQGSSSPKSGISFCDLAVDKLIHPQYLSQLGITDGHVDGGYRSIHIPYYTMDGKPHERYRIRTALTAKEGSKWGGKGTSPIPYGLEKLDMAKKAKFLVIVEGESDCWTLWMHKFPALGIPGVEHYSKIKREYLAGIERVYIIAEPPSEEDTASNRNPGQKFVENTYKHLLTLGYKGKVYEVSLHQAYGAKDPNALHKHDVKAFKTTFSQALQDASCLSPVPLLPQTHSFQDLMTRELPPINWIVPNMIAEGLTILGGKQKLGKSWLLLALGLAVAAGGLFLGCIKLEPCEVLYLALEDNERRLKERLGHILPPGGDVPRGFHYATKWPRLDAEGLQLLSLWLDEHPKVRLVIIDTWGRAKPLSRARNGYDADVDAASGIQTLAMERNISILATCHLRKAAATDALDELNATTGLSAVADNILILKRERGNAEASLFGTGREIELDKALSFNDGLWKLLGDGAVYRLSHEQKEVIETLSQTEKPLGAKEIAEFLRLSGKHISDGAIRYRLFDMKQKGLIKELERGKYTIVPNMPNVPNTPNIPNMPNVKENTSRDPYQNVREDRETLVSARNVREQQTCTNGHRKPNEMENVSDVRHVSGVCNTQEQEYETLGDVSRPQTCSNGQDTPNEIGNVRRNETQPPNVLLGKNTSRASQVPHLPGSQPASQETSDETDISDMGTETFQDTCDDTRTDGRRDQDVPLSPHEHSPERPHSGHEEKSATCPYRLTIAEDAHPLNIEKYETHRRVITAYGDGWVTHIGKNTLRVLLDGMLSSTEWKFYQALPVKDE